jgi:Ca2+-binding RTX toxin-like protein
MWGQIDLINPTGIDPHVRGGIASQLQIMIENGATVTVTGGQFVDSGSSTKVVRSEAGNSISFSGTKFVYAGTLTSGETGDIHGIDMGLVSRVSSSGTYSTNGEVYLASTTTTGGSTGSTSSPATLPPPPAPPSAPADSDAARANTLQENAAAGAYSGITLKSTDSNGDALTYSLTNDAGGRFALDSTGRIVATGTAKLDYETASVDSTGQHYYDVTATASDGSAASDPASFRVYVTNQAEHLFTASADGTLSSPVNFNTVPTSSYDLDSARYLSGDGDDFVVLPNSGSAAAVKWDYLQTFDAGSGNDTVQGGDGNDHIFGGTGADTVFGGAGADALDGGAGADVLVGGAGADQLTGGSENDIFVFTRSELGTTRAGPHDVVTDFVSGTDKIDLSDLYASHAAGPITAGRASDFTKLSGYKIEYFTANGHTYVIGDTDGVKGADFTIELSTATKLSASDFITSSSDWAAVSTADYTPVHHDLLW